MTLTSIQARGPTRSDKMRNVKKRMLDTPCRGLPTIDSVTVSFQVEPANLGPKRMHSGQKNKRPNKTPETIERHMMVPKLLRMRI